MNVLKNWIRKRLGVRCLSIVELYYLVRYRFLYRGDRFACPCCSARLSRFLALTTPSGIRSESVICPRCDSHPRHRLLWLYFHAQCRDLFDKRIQLLHLAPEFCFERHFRRNPNLNYVTADLTAPQVDLHADVCCLPFAERRFNVVLCNHVLEHVTDDRRAISEIYRVIRPGGWALMQVPVDSEREITLEDAEVRTPEERELYYGQDDHVRQYGIDFVDRIRRAGFSIDVIDYTSILGQPLVEYHGLPQRELIYLCRKPEEEAVAEEPFMR